MKNPDEESEPKLVLYVPYRSEEQREADYFESLSRDEASYNADVAEEKRWKRLGRVGLGMLCLGISANITRVMVEITTDVDVHDTIGVAGYAVATGGYVLDLIGGRRSRDALRNQIATIDYQTLGTGIRLYNGVATEAPTWLIEAVERPGFESFKPRIGNPPELGYPHKSD